MPNNPTISVIIPAFNRSDTILRCIESVKNQSLRVNEIIVIDDCSTDNTMEILNALENITILHTSNNSGAQAARNLGIKAAKSDWIAFIDSDDEWLPEKIEKQINELKKVNLDPMTVVHGDCIIDDKKSNNKIWHLEKTEGNEVYRQLLSTSGTFFPALLTSKEALKRINYLDESIESYQEWDTSIQLAKFCNFIHIQEPLFIYNIQSNSISNSDYNNINGYYKIVKKYENEIISSLGRQSVDKHLINCSNMASNNGNFKYGRQLLKKIETLKIKKILMLVLNYLHVRPNLYYQLLKKLSWKN